MTDFQRRNTPKPGENRQPPEVVDLGPKTIAALVQDNSGTVQSLDQLKSTLEQKVDELKVLVGEVQASPTENTVLDRLKDLLTGIVLAAGSAIIGQAGIDQTTDGTTNRVYVGNTASARPAGLAETALASAARTESGESELSGDYSGYGEILALLAVTAHSGTTPTLDVKIQHSVDGGTTWHDLQAFTQVAETDGTELKVVSRYYAADTQKAFGSKLKIVWTIAGDTPSYTFGLKWTLKP